jgi:SM-20-related protein
VIEVYEKMIQGLLEKGFESVDNWFTTEELVGLRQSLLQRYEKDQFHHAGIGNKENLKTITKIRSDQIYWLDRAKANEFESSFFQKMNDFIQYLNRTCFAGIQESEFHYAIYEAGSFYKKHVDRFQNDDRRQFSFVCYLTENWREGDGGELLMYKDEEPERIEPTAGRVVFFSSEIPHEVLLSHQLRLSLTGWLKTL